MMRAGGRRCLAGTPLCAALLIALLCLFASGCGSPPGGDPVGESRTSGLTAVEPGLSTSVDYVYYDVTGMTATELIAGMERCGPNGYWAYTDWSVDWSYSGASGPGGYTTGPVSVSADVVITLPRWDPPPGAPAELVGRWNRLAAALKTHEEGHRDIGLSTGKKVLDALEGLGGYSSEQALEVAAKGRANAAISEGQARDASYDAETNHGQSQGVRL